MKLQIDECMRAGFDFYYFNLWTGLTGIFSPPAAKGLSAEGRIILMIL
jgi:hypothetical protein